jgi:hypothetical protein
MTALLLAALLQAPALPAPVATTGTVRGRVVRADGLPLRLARVQLSSSERLFSPDAVPTDDDGVFEFSDIRPGLYYLRASKFGYITVAFGQRRASDRGDIVAVAAGATVDHIDIVLPRGGAIAGRITDENGDPVENVAVGVWQIKFSAGRPQLTAVPGAPTRRTNDLGRYRLFGLPAGRYLVGGVVGQINPGRPIVDLPGYARTYFPGTPDPIEAETVDVRAAQDTLNVDFSLVPARMARISGSAFDAAGEPVQNLSLAPSYRSGAVATAPVGARTSPDGTFDFPNVAPGEYVVRAARPRNGPSTEGEFGAQFVTVNGVDITGVVVRMSAGSTIAGRVTFEGGTPPKPGRFEFSPIPVDFDLTSPAGSPARADVHDDWTFDMRGANGPRRLRLIETPPGWMLKSILANGIDVTDTPLMFGTNDQSLRDVEVVLTNHVTEIGGSVADDRGRASSDYVVVAFAADRALWYQQSRFLRSRLPERDATFALRGLPPGQYYVAAIDRRREVDAAGELENPEFLESLIAHATRITLTEDQRTALTLKLF